jgi:hypothetical protein
LFSDTDHPDHAGWLQFSLNAARRSFSGRLQIGAERFPFSGHFTETHSAETAVPRKNRPELLLTLQLVTTNQDSIVVGDVSAPDWATPLYGQVLHFNSKAPTSLAGRYAVSFLNTNTSPAQPNGHGGAAIIISPSGKVTVSARTATGTAISHTAGLGKNGDFPLHLAGLKGRERALGWLRVSTSGATVRSANVWWTKQPGPDAAYPDGFDLELTALGSTWVATTANVLGFTRGVAAFFGGDLQEDGLPVSAVIQVSTRNGTSFQSADAPERVKLSVAKSTGVMKGEFRHPVTGQKLKVWGYGLPQQRTANGFFLGDAHSGSVSLTSLP